MRLLASALLVTAIAAATPALAQNAEGGPSPSRTDADNRQFQKQGEIVPEARETIPSAGLTSGQMIVTPPQISQVPMSTVPAPAPQPLTSR